LYRHVTREAQRISPAPLESVAAVDAAFAAQPPHGTVQQVLGEGSQGVVLQVRLDDGTLIARKVGL
jgi:hypothetical protein